jgi:ribosomal protein S18 acetylase RimI-like enzyme
MSPQTTLPVSISVEKVERIGGNDLTNLCEATEAAIEEGGGFGWVTKPPRQMLEKYWQGVLLVPGRTLFIGRLDRVVAGSAQLVRPPRNNEAQAFSAQLMSAFVAPWARGHGLARGLVRAAEAEAERTGVAILNLDVRETQSAAIELYESAGYIRWGVHPAYAQVAGRTVPGFYYYKRLIPEKGAPGAANSGPELDRA